MRALSAWFIFAAVAASFCGCSIDEEKVTGCTDPNATNYNPKANESDGSCLFKGTALFWYDQATADSLVNDGVTSLSIHFNDTIIGTYSVSVFFTSAPDCTDTSVVKKEKDLGSSKQKSFSYTVVNDFGLVVWSGTLNVNAAFSCNRVQLIY